MESVGERGGLALDQDRPIAEVAAGYTYFRDGDILVAKITPCFENGKGAIARNLTNGVAFGTTELHVIRPSREIEGRFLFYLSISQLFRDAGTAAMIGAAGQRRVPDDFILDYRLGVPPLDHQRAIADFLDEKTAAIDALISKTQRLIELIEEKRQATITHTVTQGLDPNAPMKDSGVEWIGEIPETWRALRIVWVAQLESGHTPDKKVESYWKDGTVPWVSLKDTKTLAAGDRISDTAVCTTEAGLANSSARLLPPNAVVFTRDATVGLAAITTRPMAVSQHLIAWVCGPAILPKYLLRVTDAMGDELQRLTWGATIKTIGMADIRELSTPLPPLSEQKSIVKELDQTLTRLTLARRRLHRQISLLREYRQTLISAAVTGQIDVSDRQSHTEPVPQEVLA